MALYKLGKMLESPKAPFTSIVKKKVDETMDNQQVKDTELAWLAGFLDGEGHISISANTSKGYLRLAPVVCFTNTNKKAVDKIQSILTRLEVPHYIQLNQRQNKLHKPCYVVEIKRYSAMATILTWLTPYLVLKQEQACLMMHCCFNKRWYFEGKTKFKNKTTETDLKVMEALKFLNKRGTSESSEAIRLTTFVDDIVHSYVKA